MTQGKMILFFQEKLKSAKVIYLYRDARLFSSSERAYSPHSFFTFRHNLSTHEHLCIFLNVWSLVWVGDASASLMEPCVFTE